MGYGLFIYVYNMHPLEMFFHLPAPIQVLYINLQDRRKVCHATNSDGMLTAGGMSEDADSNIDSNAMGNSQVGLSIRCRAH